MGRGVFALHCCNYVSVHVKVTVYISFINSYDTMEYFVDITYIHFCTIFEIYYVHVRT